MESILNAFFKKSLALLSCHFFTFLPRGSNNGAMRGMQAQTIPTDSSTTPQIKNSASFPMKKKLEMANFAAGTLLLDDMIGGM